MQEKHDAFLFEEDQRFPRWIAWAIVLGEVTLFAILAAVRISSGHAASPGFGKILVIVALANIVPMTVLAVLFARWTLKTRLDGCCLSVRLWPFGRTIPLDQIAQWEARTYRPIGEYGGWGVRYTFKNGMAYNVRGKRGVQLVLADGKRILIGSQRADELAEVISRAKQSSQGDR